MKNPKSPKPLRLEGNCVGWCPLTCLKGTLGDMPVLPALTGAAGFRLWVPDHMASSPASHSQLEVLTTVTTLLSKLRNVGFFFLFLYSLLRKLCVCICVYKHIYAYSYD